MLTANCVLLCLLLQSCFCEQVVTPAPQPHDYTYTATTLPSYIASADGDVRLNAPFPLTLHYSVYNLFTVMPTGEIRLTSQSGATSNTFAIQITLLSSNTVASLVFTSTSTNLTVHCVGGRTGDAGTL